LHTASPISIQEMEEVLNRQAETEEQEGRALLEHAQRTLASFGIQAHTAIARGDAATEIIDYVKEHQIDLIIAGSRGLGAVRSWLLGSVSRKLVHYAGCSVLIVRGAA
jgi:nucleotide-binding universal stress UspA family protein